MSPSPFDKIFLLQGCHNNVPSLEEFTLFLPHILFFLFVYLYLPNLVLVKNKLHYFIDDMLSALFDPVLLWSHYWKSSLNINKISENSFPIFKKNSILTIRKHVFDWTDINYMFITFIKSYYGLLFYFNTSPSISEGVYQLFSFFFS